MNQDRYGLFRPTIEEDGTVHDEWKTVRNVHLDVSAFYIMWKWVFRHLDEPFKLLLCSIPYMHVHT